MALGDSINRAKDNYKKTNEIKEKTKPSLLSLRQQVNQRKLDLERQGISKLKFTPDQINNAVNRILDESNIPPHLKIKAELYIRNTIRKIIDEVNGAKTSQEKENILKKAERKIDKVRKKFGIDNKAYKGLLTSLVAYLGPKSFLGRMIDKFLLKKKPGDKGKKNNKKTASTKASANNSPQKNQKKPDANPQKKKNTPGKKPDLAKKPTPLEAKINRFASLAQKQKWTLDRATAKSDYALAKKLLSAKDLATFDKTFDKITNTTTKSGRVLDSMLKAVPINLRNQLKLRTIYMVLNAFPGVDGLINMIGQLKGKKPSTVEAFVVHVIKIKGKGASKILDRYKKMP